jgi:hypothetical protein
MVDNPKPAGTVRAAAKKAPTKARAKKSMTLGEIGEQLMFLLFFR